MGFRSLHLFTLSFTVCGLMSCSVDMFSKEKKDPTIDGRENYRRITPECSGIKVEKSELDPATFRALVRCFNANGSISEFATLVNAASEKSLTQSVELLNTSFQALLVGRRAGIPVQASNIQAFTHIASPLVKTLPLLGRVQSSLSIGLENWQGFFKKFERLLLNPDFAPVMKELQSLAPLNTAASREVIGPAVMPNRLLLLDALAKVECEMDSRDRPARADEVVREFNEGVLGWERLKGKLPLAWDSELLKSRLRAFSNSLKSPVLRKHLYSWLAGLDPDEAAAWFLARAQDPRLVAVMDPESKKPRVRWMTTLDRLESILVNSNFTYLLSGNYGLKFIEKFAESWGDEPREKWPSEIQARFSGSKRPPTLRESYDEVLQTINWFERVGGQPTVPPCVNSDLLSPPWGSAPEFVFDFEVKAKAFNLKQTITVIEENLPDARGPNAGGMRLLRDLFWAVNSSVAHADRDPSRPGKNPIRFLQRLGDLGVLRAKSRGLQAFETRGELMALADVFSGLKMLAAEPAFDRILARMVDSPTSFETWITTAYQDRSSKLPFQFSRFMPRILQAIAADRSLRMGPTFLRFFDQSLPQGKLPETFIADLIRSVGEFSEAEVRLFTVRAQLDRFERFFKGPILDLLGSFPVGEVVTLLERDPVLRSYISRQLNDAFSEIRESDLERVRPYLRLFLSEEKPELRRMFARWCGRSGATSVHEFAAHPDESVLMIDGLLKLTDSAGFKDFLEALLHQLPD